MILLAIGGPDPGVPVNVAVGSIECFSSTTLHPHRPEQDQSRPTGVPCRSIPVEPIMNQAGRAEGLPNRFKDGKRVDVLP